MALLPIAYAMRRECATRGQPYLDEAAGNIGKPRQVASGFLDAHNSGCWNMPQSMGIVTCGERPAATPRFPSGVPDSAAALSFEAHERQTRRTRDRDRCSDQPRLARTRLRRRARLRAHRRHRRTSRARIPHRIYCRQFDGRARRRRVRGRQARPIQELGRFDAEVRAAESRSSESIHVMLVLSRSAPYVFGYAPPGSKPPS